MKKLFKLKEWLTISEAAKHLSLVLEGEVTDADVLRLALDGHLTLSVNFVNHSRARCGKVVPVEMAKYVELPTLPNLAAPADAPGKPFTMMKGLPLNDEQIIELNDDIVTLDGVYDLMMIGNERLDLEHEYQQLTGGPAVTLIDLNGTFVKSGDGTICQLLQRFDENEYSTGAEAQRQVIDSTRKRQDVDPPEGNDVELDKNSEKQERFPADSASKRKPRKELENYYPAAGLPDDAVVVVRTEALREFQESIGDPAEKAIASRERNTLLVIIAALCQHSRIDYEARGIAKQITGLTEDIGAPVTDDTVRKVLEQIPDAVETRGR